MKTLPILILTLAAGCTAPASKYATLLPDDRLLIDGFDATAAMRAAGEPSHYFELTRQVTGDVNQMVGDVLHLVGEITSFDPSWSDEDKTALWGPWLDGGTYGQLWVREKPDQSYAWAIEIRDEASAEDAWTAVLAGKVEAGATELASSGFFAMDFDAIDGAGAGDGQLGKMACEYALFEGGAEATVALGDFSEDGSVPADAGVRYDHVKGEGGSMDLAINGDISEPQNGTLEMSIIRSRWNGVGAGRSDAYVTGGDLGPLTYTESECWGASHQVVFWESNFDLDRSGDEAQCAFGDASYNEVAR